MFNENQILDNTYQILRELGAGGTSSVYLAYHLRLQKYVVIKRLRGTFSSDFLMRTEVDILKNLHHPYLPQVYDFLQNGNEVYTVIDFVDGYDLQSYIESGMRLPEHLLKRYLRQVAEVLGYLHEQNPPVIHSDIKPGNIIINQNGDAVLIDFNTSIGGNQGNILGLTLPYASPEQAQMAQNAFAGQASPFVLDGRTDIYSLGATFYELICGIRPTYGVPPTPLHTMNLPDYSHNFLLLIDRMMDYDREKRVQTAKKLVTSIDRLDKRYLAHFTVRCISILLSAVLVAAGAYCLIRGIKQESADRFIQQYTTATMLIEQGAFEQAKTVLDSLAADGKVQSYLQKESSEMARFYHAQGDIYYYNDQYSDAATYYGYAVNYCHAAKMDNKEYVTFLRDAAIAYAQSGDIALAQSMLQLARQNQASDEELQLVDIVLQARLGNVDACFTLAQEYISSTQDKALCLRAALAAASASRSIDEQIQWLEKAMPYDNGKTVSRGLAVAYGEKAQQSQNVSAKETALQKAADLYDQLCSSLYASTNDHINYAVVLRMMGDYTKALQVLQQAPRQNTGYYRVLANMCFVYYEMGDNTNAALYCSQAADAWHKDFSSDKATSTDAEIQNLNEISQRLGLGGI